MSAICRRNTVEDPTAPKYTPWLSREDPQLFQRACDGGARHKDLDPFGYHFVGCKIGANEAPQSPIDTSTHIYH